MTKIIIATLTVVLLGGGFWASNRISEVEEEAAALRKDLSRTKTQLEQRIGKERFLTEKITGIKARIVTNLGNIEVKFFPEKAPLQCYNFITRAESGFYDSTQFHRVIKGFMIQGGDPNSKNDDPFDDGRGKPMVSIPHEFNDTRHLPGILSTARPGDESAGAGSQFFIMHGSNSNLDGNYTAFGEVIKGMDVVNAIATTSTNKTNPRLIDRPVEPVTIRRILLYR